MIFIVAATVFAGVRTGPRMRKVHLMRSNKRIPDHHTQMEVNFPTFLWEYGEKNGRFQHTSIADATRVRVLMIYETLTRADANDCVDRAIKKFPLRI